MEEMKESTKEEREQDISFLTHIIFEIRNYAISAGQDPDDTLKSIAEWILALLQIATFEGRAKDEQSSCSEKPNRSDLISKQAAIDVLDVLCQEHRYKIPGKRETYSQYNEAWQDALSRAEGAIFNLPTAQPEIIRCKDCKHRDVKTGFCEGRGWPMQLVPDDGFCDKGGKGAKNDA